MLGVFALNYEPNGVNVESYGVKSTEYRVQMSQEMEPNSPVVLVVVADRIAFAVVNPRGRAVVRVEAAPAAR